MKVNSKRSDGKGHWQFGRPRSTVSDIDAEFVRSILSEAAKTRSMASIARELGAHQDSLAKVVAGKVRPSELTRDRVMRLSVTADPALQCVSQQPPHPEGAEPQ